MALKKSEKRLLIILGIAVVAFLGDKLIFKSEDKKEGSFKVPDKYAADQPVKGAEKASGLEGQPVVKRLAGKATYYDSWGRDPFARPGRRSTARIQTSVRKKQFSKPELKGIISKGGRYYVLINDLILGEGEEKDGIKVERIKEKEVLCSQDSRTFTLSWGESP